MGFDLEPAAFDHPIGGGIRIWKLREFGRELLGGVGRQRLSKALAVIDNGLGVFRIQNGFEFGSRGRRRRRALFLFFLSSYLIGRRYILYARHALA